MRGEVADSLALDVHVGITPACAGRRRTFFRYFVNSKDHPRVCGEKYLNYVFTIPPPGSPPRVRGEDLRQASLKADRGITPACAGRRSAINQFVDMVKDHPRVCGEKFYRFFSHIQPMGSPPRVRGEAGQAVDDVQPAGITPACAGRRAELSIVPDLSEDHPRVCGEKYARHPGRFFRRGSPPRVRGEGALQR